MKNNFFSVPNEFFVALWYRDFKWNDKKRKLEGKSNEIRIIFWMQEIIKELNCQRATYQNKEAGREIYKG